MATMFSVGTSGLDVVNRAEDVPAARPEIIDASLDLCLHVAHAAVRQHVLRINAAPEHEPRTPFLFEQFRIHSPRAHLNRCQGIDADVDEIVEDFHDGSARMKQQFPRAEVVNEAEVSLVVRFDQLPVQLPLDQKTVLRSEVVRGEHDIDLAAHLLQGSPGDRAGDLEDRIEERPKQLLVGHAIDVPVLVSPQVLAGMDERGRAHTGLTRNPFRFESPGHVPSDPRVLTGSQGSGQG